MASNALAQVTNNGTRPLAFEVDISNPVKLVCKLVLPPGIPVEIEIETIVPLVLFDSSFQDEVISGRVSIAFAFTTSGNVPSTSGNFLTNIRRFLAATGPGWSAV